jgi:hypothetical protein
MKGKVFLDTGKFSYAYQFLVDCGIGLDAEKFF